VVGRKAWLLSDTTAGAHARAVTYSLIETAKVLGIPTQTQDNWRRLLAQGKLTGAGAKAVSAELTRVKMERDILKKATAYFAKDVL